MLWTVTAITRPGNLATPLMILTCKKKKLPVEHSPEVIGPCSPLQQHRYHNNATESP